MFGQSIVNKIVEMEAARIHNEILSIKNTCKRCECGGISEYKYAEETDRIMDIDLKVSELGSGMELNTTFWKYNFHCGKCGKIDPLYKVVRMITPKGPEDADE